ncbi:hypothetical protein L917_01907 [Phytophthora nicotianae]|uniref:Uncharacterized protein n=1 Tax=Phytophthora nicotianae TaxID=4792 RepID=W2LY08_PHYNI|nr:hypothetical protein L917_01907 [Phytophthora nicotianae]
MPNVTSWTETEISVLIQTWAEVEAKYPILQRGSVGSVTIHSKMYALYSKRCPFARSSSAVNRAKNLLRIFVLFVHQFNEERRQKGERLWFDINVTERRDAAPMKLRGLAVTVNQEAYARLMTMERARRWLAATAEVKQERPRLTQLEAAGVSNGDELSLSSEASTPCTEQGADKSESRASIAAPQRSSSSSCSPSSLFGDDSELSCSSSSNTTKSHKKPELPAKLKHRDCNILLESMMKLQAEKMRHAVTKLRTDIIGALQHSSEMLLSIISNQFEEPESSGDIAFVTKVLNMQKQQVRDRFDQFEEKQTRQEAENRALIG